MIKYHKTQLSNGLKIIVHRDINTPLVAFNLLYDVGSRDENPEKTGFAHLFEHLMFEGSSNVPKFDKPIQEAAGSNNAFTSRDITNYYITLPAVNVETAFWVESDRMKNLLISEKSLETQKKSSKRRVSAILFKSALWRCNVAFARFSIQNPSVSLESNRN